MKIRGRHVVIVVLLLSSAILAYDSLTRYVNPYLSVAQVAKFPERYANREVQVIGVVDLSSVYQDGGVVKFDVTDGGYRLPIVYRGTLPQNFERSDKVVVIGKVDGTGSLESSQILVKCPSKYESNEEPPISSQLFIAVLLLVLAATVYLAVTVLWKKG